MTKIDSIDRELTLPAPIERVWAALTNAKEVAQWFGSDAQFELREGATGYFEWNEGGCAGQYAMRIERIEPMKYFAWRWMQDKDVAFDSVKSTLVEWHLSSDRSGGTLLKLTESEFVTLKQRGMNVDGWQIELGDLEKYLNQ